MRKGLLKTAAAVLILAGMLTPVAQKMAANSQRGVQDAEHAVLPMVELLAQSAVHSADIAVGPMMDIEDAWAIEDTRTEAQTPLLAGMRSGMREMGYDADDWKFYCTLGNDWKPGDPWPELDLYAKNCGNDDSLTVCWIDDYSYDDCEEAIRKGYAYEMLAYTDTEYAYYSVVFTGLPIVTIHVGGDTEFSEDYIPACVTLSSANEEESAAEMAQVHLRGNRFEHRKWSFRMEFHEISQTGRDKKKDVAALGMEPDSDWLLVSNIQDPAAMRNYLSFQKWKEWNEGKPAMNVLDSRLVEVFVQDEYMGMYQLLQRVKPEVQIERAGGNPETDCLLRTVYYEDDKKPHIDLMDTHGVMLRYQYERNGQIQRAFDLAEDYLRLTSKTDPIGEEEFIRLAEECVDVDNVLSYYLFIQAAGLTVDNCNNNLYLWMAWDGERYVYRYAPWDMDYGIHKVDYTAEGEVYLYFDLSMELPRRMLDLNVMNARERLWALWEEKRATVFSDESIESWIRTAEAEVHRSGAYLRESEKWLDEEQNLYLDDLLEFELEQMNTVEKVLRERWPLENAE